MTKTPFSSPLVSPITSLTMSSREIADLAGKEHKNVMADIRNMLEELQITSAEFSANLPDTYGRPQPVFLLPKRETLILVSGYNVELRAKIIDRWQEIEQLISTTPPPAISETVQIELMFAETAARMLNVSSSGKLGMLQTIRDLHGLPNLLPRYAIDAPSDAVDGSSRPTYSATEGLKALGAGISAKAFNQLLESHGLLQKMSRPSTKAPDKQKEFWVVTSRGLLYGKNIVDPRCQRETQPHWFQSRFKELLSAVGLAGKVAA